jgi:phosphatidylserine/phosphatidylglycerophosphate/cardiolipin synthase-like enzyme
MLEDFERALADTLDDLRLSRAERKALLEVADVEMLGPRERDRLRARAFDLARDAQDAANTEAVFAWLEDVIRVLSTASPDVEEQVAEAEAWFSPGDAPRRAILRQLQQVRQRADLCVFTITDDRISDGILSIAARGVKTRLITDDDKLHDLGSDVMRFRDAGIDVAIDSTPAHMHHKFGVFDEQRLLTGSFNWTRAASATNHENLLFTTDRRLVDAYRAEFARLWAGYA